MAATTTNRTTKDRQQATPRRVEPHPEFTSDLANYLIDYARKNPGYAALTCIGIGFVLGWKLKPW
jgi:hypothetical protein